MGVYRDLTNEAYHREPDHLSSTYLKRLIPERYTLPDSRDALDFGTLFHAFVLEPDTVGEVPEQLGLVVLDPKVIGVKADGKPSDSPTSTKAWKEAVAAVKDSGRRVVTQARWDEWCELAEAMTAAVRVHPAAAALLAQADAEPEISVFVEDEAGIRHKARFDLLGTTAVDLKSTSARPSADALTRATIDYGYDLSAAHYLEVAALEGIEVDGFALIFVTKTPPHRVLVTYLDEAFLARGRVLRALAIERHVNENAPRYEGADAPLTLTPPGWARLTETVPAGIPADFTWSVDEYS